MTTYKETSEGGRMILDWGTVVSKYARHLFSYGFAVGAAGWALLNLWPENGQPYMPASGSGWAWLLLTSVLCGLVVGGGAAWGAVWYKDLTYLSKYRQPTSTLRELSPDAAPASMKPGPLSRQMEDGSIRFGVHKLERPELYALAKAVVLDGEDLISIRKLHEWKVIPGREGPEGKRLIEDMRRLGYVDGAGNQMNMVKPEFVDYLETLFPRL